MLGLATETGCAPPATISTGTSSAKPGCSQAAANTQIPKLLGEVSGHAQSSTRAQTAYELSGTRSQLTSIKLKSRKEPGQAGSGNHKGLSSPLGKKLRRRLSIKPLPKGRRERDRDRDSEGHVPVCVCRCVSRASSFENWAPH